MEKATKALILTGGGAKGAFQAGVIDKLYDEGYRPDVIMGVSVGALNGVMCATGQQAALSPLWETLSNDMVLEKRTPISVARRYIFHKMGLSSKSPLAFNSNKPLKETLSEYIGRTFTTHFVCGSVNLTNGKYHDYKAKPQFVSYNSIDPVIASTAIPVVFDPIMSYRYKGSDAMYVDGGVKNMSPIGTAIKDYPNINEIVIISCKPYQGRRYSEQQIDDLPDVAKTSLGYMMDEVSVKDIREFVRINKMVEQAEMGGVTLRRSNGQPYKKIDAVLYEPTESLGDALNFTSKQAKRNIRHGLETKPIIL